MTAVNTTPGDATSRKPLDAQFVGKINADAMKALGDVRARRKWADSDSGSPVTTNILCAEIARLNMAFEKIIEATQSSVDDATAAIRANKIAMAAIGRAG